MKIAFTLSGFTLMVLSLVVSHSDAQLVDDFSDRNLDGWTPVVLRMENMGSEIIDASSGALHLGSTGETVDAARDSFVGMSWDESNDPIYSNGFLRARFTINESANNFGLYTRVSDDSASWYRFGATSISPIIRGDPGVFVFTKSKDEVITENELVNFGDPKLNEEWMLEGGMSGNKLSMKWWKVGEPEPTQPLWEWIDNDPLSQGTFGMGTFVDQTGILVTGSPPPWRLGITVDDLYFTPVPDPNIDWRSEGRFDASTTPLPTAFNTLVEESVSDVALVDVNFEHEIAALDGGVLQLNNGSFTISAANGDALDGTYTDFRYTPVEGEPGLFTGAGSYEFIGGSGVFFGASGSGSWVAEAGFDVGSASMGFANHNWTGKLNLDPDPLPGDIDDDGKVVFDDFLVLADNFGADVDRYTSGDLDGDGNVAFADFVILSNNFGRSSIAAAAVPEPSSLSLLAFAALGLGGFRRRT